MKSKVKKSIYTEVSLPRNGVLKTNTPDNSFYSLTLRGMNFEKYAETGVGVFDYSNLTIDELREFHSAIGEFLKEVVDKKTLL